ncbi:hypothetical protein [Clostridium baratii]|uniref:hypothetical protein n=1 Tax=Clostridium baratii TaxID=1561 RepID=UPI0005F2C00A|nr:hypothetical protein [Clostridium baratii]KJU70784.1 hypothetical protein UC77_12990 [Clostridium baratii]MBS6043580.1 hypothetical protein [Clostridium baratii]MBT9832841.1 hypothetical protein [Clostridium baratii]MDY3206929.1 hypothetical protein [Clostridium baratii]STA99239.1 Uncharacterised protein [Clostridium baratii]
MFLKEFNKEEAKAFINLVNQFANIDDNFVKEEEKLIKEYKNELNLEEDYELILAYDEVISILRRSSERIKKIVYFELVGLALIDGNYEDIEVDFLDKIAIDLDINRSIKIEFANFFYNFKEVSELSLAEIKAKDIDNLEEKARALL